MICSADGCKHQQVTGQWCNKHYRRMLKYGSTELPTRPDAVDRFWSKVDRTQSCWNWLASVDTHGYGHIKIDGKLTLSHRFSYGLEHRSVPDYLDHVCHNRRCVNPEHLRPATKKQNAENHSGARSDSKSGVRGVFRHHDGLRWRAQVGHRGRIHHVGLFATVEEAAEAVRIRRNELFTRNDADRGIACGSPF